MLRVIDPVEMLCFDFSVANRRFASDEAIWVLPLLKARKYEKKE